MYKNKLYMLVGKCVGAKKNMGVRDRKREREEEGEGRGGDWWGEDGREEKRQAKEKRRQRK